MKILFLSDFVPSDKIRLDDSFVQLIDNTDRVIFNLEGSPLTNTKFDLNHQIMPFEFKKLLKFLTQLGKEKFIIALANNHMLDNGEYGFNYLINKLEENRIAYFGTREKPYIAINNEVSVLNFVTAETVARYSNSGKLNYVFYNPKQTNDQIKELEKKKHQLILYPHWGRDMDRSIFDTYNLKFSRDDWHIFGHHPHVISGISDKSVYSMGNTFIPHPYYYKRYPAMRYGLAISYDTSSKKYTTTLTEVTSEDGYEEDFALRASKFTKIPSDVISHGKNYSKAKKYYHKLFAFKGNSFDLLKLVALQFLSVAFQIRLRILER